MASFQNRLLAAIIKSLLRGKSLVQAILAYWVGPLTLSADDKSRAFTPSRKSPDEFLREAQDLLLGSVDRNGLRQLSQGLYRQFLERLENDMGSMLPSYSHQLPKGTESGEFLTLDVGGSTLRVALVELGVGEESKIGRMQSFHIDSGIKNLEGMDFFDWMAARIADTLEGGLKSIPDGSLPLSMAWSFPIE